ncbi:unnamed protein product [Clonostachys byssicola]|uniref:Uncharacterized protein n=1 Tax=Clonostachys byssicola TaxID=160290 RepID=A0A9N9U0P8_9HYPO|nr:unnamed protein product [Clonostachys byssicola]
MSTPSSLSITPRGTPNGNRTRVLWARVGVPKPKGKRSRAVKSKLIASEGCIAWYVYLSHFEMPELIANYWDIVKKP